MTASTARNNDGPSVATESGRSFPDLRWTALPGEGPRSFAIILAVTFSLATTGCAPSGGAGLVRNDQTRQGARACGLTRDAVAIDRAQSRDLPTIAILKHTADRHPQAWHCLQDWASANGYRAAYQLEVY